MFLHTADREKFAITPQIGRPAGEFFLAQRLFHAVEIVADQERFSRARQVVHLVGGVMFAGRGAFEMRDEGRTFRC